MFARDDIRALTLVVAAMTAGCSRSGSVGPTGGGSGNASAAAVASGSAPTEVPSPSEQLDVPSPGGGGPLVPWMPASAWHGPGAPPKQFSLFAIPERSPVLRYAALDRDRCEDALQRRGVAFARAEDTQGVRAPVRLAGTLHGVAIHSPLPASLRAKSRADLIDCRLALALDDFAASLESRGVAEVIHVSAYRTRREGGCTPKYDGEQHCAALAVDVTSFTRKNGTKLVVERDFHGKVGLLTCAETARNELWDIACAAAGRQFQVVLTPNWDAAHRNHLHLELTEHDWVLAR